MFENLKVFEERYEALNGRLYDPAVTADLKAYSAIRKEHKEIEPLVLKYRAFCVLEREIEELSQMAQNEPDEELRALAAEELAAAKEQLAACEREIRLLLIPKDPNDDKNVIMELRAGAGGEEAALFAAVLFRMYSLYAASKGWQIETVFENETELGGYRGIEFIVSGEGAYSRLKYESGVHRVQRVPETETQGRIHTSTCTVAVLPEVDEVEIEINPKDLQIDTFRSSGAGGQKVNKTSSAIRITHLPTGMVVECQDERSQYKNKDKALKVLRARLYEKSLREQQSQISAERKSQVGTGDRSERIRTYNYPQGRITDHRIGFTIYRLEDFLSGNIDEVIDALIAADRAEKMEDRIELENGI